MILKQKTLKRKKNVSLLITLIVNILIFAFFIVELIFEKEKFDVLLFFFILWIPLFLLEIFGIVFECEWFYIYEDRIEARWIFGRKNVVYLSNVKYIEDVFIWFNRSWEEEYYIFNDGRKNNNSILDRNSWANKKNLTLEFTRHLR